MFPERQYQNGKPVFLEILYRVSRNTAVKDGVSVFCNCQWFFIFKRISLI